MSPGSGRRANLATIFLIVGIICAVVANLSLLLGGDEGPFLSLFFISAGGFCFLLWGLWGGLRSVMIAVALTFANYITSMMLGNATVGGLWIVIGAMLFVVGVLAHWAPRREAKREKRRNCPGCGHPLTYLEVQRCPKCGCRLTLGQSGIPMTYLCVPITAGETDRAKADADRAIAAGADCLELRTDLMGEADAPAVIRHVGGRVPIIATVRSREEGGAFDADDRQRIARMVELGTCSPGLIDCEWATYQRSANIRQKIGLVTGPDSSSKNRLILSLHDFSGRPRDLAERADAMAASPADVVKFVWMPRSIVDNFEAFRLMRELPKPVIAICMGPAGVASRVLAGKFGAFLSFAALEQDSGSAPGQVTIDQMQRLYGWQRQGPDTKVYGVIACPVAHSMSPAVHNASFAQTGFDGVYLPLHVEPGHEAFAAFMDAVIAHRWADFYGFSVTIPHKQNALRWLREHEADIEPLAERIAAVNTIAIDEDGSVHGMNTDYAGAIDALTHRLGCERSDLAGLPVAVLGARGTARAVVAGLCDCGCRVTIYNRTAAKAKELADEFDCNHAPWEDRGRLEAKMIVNTTSVGMHRADDPTAEEHSPLPPDALRRDLVVFDAVYNPPQTRLLRDAAEAGCHTVSGVAMFVAQAAAQFERWTGRPAPRGLMSQVVLRELGLASTHLDGSDVTQPEA